MATEQDPPRSLRSDEPWEAGAESPESSVQGGSEVAAPDSTSGEDESETKHRGRHRETAPNMLPGRQSRRFGLERILVRLIATAGIVGIGVAIAAIMVSSKSQGWIIGVVVSAVSVVLSAILWSSRSV
jgi:hypothetical protein